MCIHLHTFAYVSMKLHEFAYVPALLPNALLFFRLAIFKTNGGGSLVNILKAPPSKHCAHLVAIDAFWTVRKKTNSKV